VWEPRPLLFWGGKKVPITSLAEEEKGDKLSRPRISRGVGLFHESALKNSLFVKKGGSPGFDGERNFSSGGGRLSILREWDELVQRDGDGPALTRRQERAWNEVCGIGKSEATMEHFFRVLPTRVFVRQTVLDPGWGKAALSKQTRPRGGGIPLTLHWGWAENTVSFVRGLLQGLRGAEEGNAHGEPPSLGVEGDGLGKKGNGLTKT